MQNTDKIWTIVDSKQADYIELSDRIFEMPELNYREVKSAAAHAEQLRREGFRVETGIAGLPTAVMGEAGEEGPVIAILGEYDALPELSQTPGISEHRPLPNQPAGHGCGHNLLGAGAMLAAAAVKDLLAERGLKGRVRYYGCPAEEGGAGKAFMVKEGAFKDVDIAISWHPADFAAVTAAMSLANTTIDFEFSGRASHAAAAPHLGRSALDAAELMNIGVNYMREHMPSDARIHYAYLDAGGIAPNVVQAKARLRYVVRATMVSQVHELLARVRKIAEGAALMTETTVTDEVVSAMSNLLANTPLEDAMQRNFDRLGPPPFDAEDVAFARRMQKTVTPAHVESAFRRSGLPATDFPLCNAIAPKDVPGPRMMGSTDVGDVSWAVPTVQARGATYTIGTPGHSWQLTAHGQSPLAHKGMVHVAKVMAGVAVDVLVEPGLLEQAKADFEERLVRTPYKALLPDDAKPPFHMF